MSAPVSHPQQTLPPTLERPRKKGLLAGIAVAIACAVACSAPLLLGAGALASAGAYLVGAGGFATLGLVAAALGAGWWSVARSHRGPAATTETTSCGCGGGC